MQEIDGPIPHHLRQWWKIESVPTEHLLGRRVTRPAGLGAARHERERVAANRRDWRCAAFAQRAKARPAGLEPATPGLEGRSRPLRIVLPFTDSRLITVQWVVEAC